MKHIEAALLQQYLAGEADLADAELIGDHLGLCPLCSDQLAAIAADDAHLTQSLALDDAEQAWIAGMDLTGPVLSEITPWYRQRHWLGILLVALLAGAWLSQATLALLGARFGPQGPVGLAVDLAETLIPALWRFTLYVANGGLLPTLWPALILGGALWLRARHVKEDKDYA